MWLPGNSGRFRTNFKRILVQKLDEASTLQFFFSPLAFKHIERYPFGLLWTPGH